MRSCRGQLARVLIEAGHSATHVRDLDLAVRGKLVEQEPDDESAAELLKHIAAEKVRLVGGLPVISQKCVQWA